MPQVTEVYAPVENVNDETIAVLRWLVDNGSFVKEGTSLVLAETTKTSFDVPSPVSGFVWQIAQAGTDIPTGSVLCYIGDDLESVKTTASNQTTATPPTQEDSDFATPLPPSDGGAAGPGSGGPSRVERPPARFTAKAMALIQKLALNPDSFAGRGLVREQDVLSYRGERGSNAGRPANAATPATATERLGVSPAVGVPVRVEALSRSKRYEGRHLRASFSNTLPSAVTIAVPTGGNLLGSRQEEGIAGLPAASVIYEAARLLRVYPMFNAFYMQDEIHYYEEVNIGYAIDLGKGLKVPVVRHADRKNLTEIADEKQRLLVDYLNDSLTLASLAGGTFTLTDLSGEGVSHFQPVINDGQSAILGVCAETLLTESGRCTFNLVLAFDHQLAEGRTAAGFLRDLRERLIAHQASLQRTPQAPEPRCALCLRPAGELEGDRQFLVRTVPRQGGIEELICTICLQDW